MFNEIASPDIYERNAFRVLELPTDATARDINRRYQTVDLAHRNNMSPQPGLGRCFPLEPLPDDFTVREAMHRLSDPENRLADELFWFWPLQAGQGTRDSALTLLREGREKEAEGVWLERESDDECVVSAHNLALLYHLRALTSEQALLKAPSGPPPVNELPKLWERSLQRWADLHDNLKIWEHLRARIEHLNDPRLTQTVADDFQNALPVALTAIAGALAIKSVEAGQKGNAERIAETIRRSGLPATAIDDGLHEAALPLRNRVRELCKSAVESAELDPIHADATCRGLLEAAKPLLSSLVVLLKSGDSARDLPHDDVAEHALQCQVIFGKKTEDWRVSVKLLEAVTGIAATEKVTEKIKEQLEVCRKLAKTNDDFCGSGYFGLPEPLLGEMEAARAKAKAHQFDEAVAALEGILAKASTPDLPLVRKALAYTLGCRAAAGVNSAIAKHNQDPPEIARFVERVRNDRISSTDFMCAQMGEIPQYMSCNCMACGNRIEGSYAIFKWTFGDQEMPIVLCRTHADSLRRHRDTSKAALKTTLGKSALDFVRAADLDPSNQFVQEQVKVIKDLCKSLEVPFPSVPKAKAPSPPKPAVPAAKTPVPAAKKPAPAAKTPKIPPPIASPALVNLKNPDADGAIMFALLGVLCGVFTAIPAVVFGHRALKAITASGGRLPGRSTAIFALCLGYLQLIGFAALTLNALR